MRAPAQELHNLDCFQFFPDISRMEPPGVKRVGLANIVEEAVRITGKWGE